MENQDSLTPTQYGKMVGMFPDPPHNPLPTGGYMDAGFDWVVHQAETFGAEECGLCGDDLILVQEGNGQKYKTCLGEYCGYVLPMNAETFCADCKSAEGCGCGGKRAETISKDMTFNIGIEDASIENEGELEERGYSQDEIENMREEITSRMLKNGKDEILESIKENHLDSVGGDTYYIDDDSVYLKNRDAMVEDVEATIDYEVDAGGWSAETIKTGVICGDNGCSGELLETEYGKASKVHCNKCDYFEIMEWDAEMQQISDDEELFGADSAEWRESMRVSFDESEKWMDSIGVSLEELEKWRDSMEISLEELERTELGAEMQQISDDEELFVVRNDMGQTKGFVEMEDDLEDESIEIEISDDEMNEIADITLDAEFSAQGKQYPFFQDTGDLYVLDKTAKGNYVIKTKSGSLVAELSPMYSQVNESFAKRVVEDLNGNADQKTADLLNFIGNKTQAGHAQDIGFNRAETTMTVEHKDGHRYSETDPVHGERGEIIGHVSEITEEKDTPYQKIYDTDFVKPSRDWFSLALGTAAVVIGGSLFLQNRSMFKADGDEMAPVGTGEPSLVAHPSTGDLLPADYEEMIVESTGYAVPIIPVSLDPAFMGSRFHALPTDRTVESNEPGIGAHTDVAMTRDTDFREPEQSMITRFNADGENCECSLLERIKSFFTGKSCCEGKEVKEANSVTGQTPYFGVGFDGKNTQTRVIKETNPVSLDPSTAPYIPQNLSGYTGQAYTPPTVYSDMMNIGVSGQNPAFVSTQSSSLQSVHGNLSAGMNQNYTDGSRTMSLSQWSIDYDVSQTSDSEAFAVSRSSGVRTMIRRV